MTDTAKNNNKQKSPKDLNRIAVAIRDQKVEAVGICLLNSYANPTNERIIADYLRIELDIPVCISAEISPQLREYPRMITTACNAATMPVIGPYLAELQKWLASEGFGGLVLMMLSNGGVVSADDAARAPIRLVESGPAAGALAGSWFARRMKEPAPDCAARCSKLRGTRRAPAARAAARPLARAQRRYPLPAVQENHFERHVRRCRRDCARRWRAGCPGTNSSHWRSRPEQRLARSLAGPATGAARAAAKPAPSRR